MTQTLNIDQTKQVLNALKTLSPLSNKPYSGHTTAFSLNQGDYGLIASGFIALWDGEDKVLDLRFKDTNSIVLDNKDVIIDLLNDIAPNK